MTYMLCKHRVIDFARWQKIFASHEEAQRQSGLHLIHLLHEMSNPNDIVYLFKVDDLKKAQTFTQAPGASQAAQDSGVVGTVEIRYLSD